MKKTEQDKSVWNHTCFVKGTKVIMSDLSLKNIEDIEVGDSIISLEMKSMTLESDIVTILPPMIKQYQLIRMTLSNGVVNEFSPAHPFWIKDKGWSVFSLEEANKEIQFEVSKFVIGDVVLFYDDEELVEYEIEELIETTDYVEMYNVEFVQKNHNFFAKGVLVHNKHILSFEDFEGEKISKKNE